MSEHGLRGSGRPRSSGLTPWLTVILSALGSAAAVAAVGSFCAIIYPILRELRAERLPGENGSEKRMLGFWSILVISVLAGCISWIFSWVLTYLDSYQHGMAFPSLLSLPDFRKLQVDVLHVETEQEASDGATAACCNLDLLS
ncbi:hypothetical protein XENORESO_021217 [Xenotaenia resolanae]|uniref:ADP-ribosylation factor-like protein 6-interacting protein 6 n=1 Tax=Xenotaenia resolanae TaxID=208358 RepID=A0ABV0X194_9TELE